MPNRRRRYLASEREAEFVIQNFFRILIFVVGAFVAIVTLGYALRQREDTDLLAPVKKHNALRFAFSRLSRLDKERVVLSLIFIPISIIAVGYQYLSLLGLCGWSTANFFTVTSILFLGTVLGIVWWNSFFRIMWELDLDAPERYKTLFRDGDTAYYDQEHQLFPTYTIRVPRDLEWNAERSTRLVEQLTHSFAPLLFRVYADDRTIVWQVVDILMRDTESIENAIRISYPEADVRVGIPQELADQPDSFYRLTLSYRAENDFIFPFKYTSDVKDFDPLTAIVSAMNGLQSGERIIYSVFVAGAAIDAHRRGQRLITQSTIKPRDYLTGRGWRRIAAIKSLNLEYVDKYVPKDQEVGEEKLRHPLFQALFTLQIDSPEEDRILSLATNIDSQLYGFARSPYNGLRWYTGIPDDKGNRIPPDPQSLIVRDAAYQWFRGSILERIIDLTETRYKRNERKTTRLILGGREIGLLWHLPVEGFSASRIHWLSSHTVPPPSAIIYQADQASVLLGHGTSGGKLFPIYLPIKDRENHIRIIGRTGVGKSTLLYDLIMQDIRKGCGVAVIDPHGSLVQNILETKLTEAEFERVVVLDLSNRVTPPPLNPLRGGLGHVRVGQIVQSIERIYPATSKYPRVSYYLRAALLTLNVDREATMKDVVRLFTDSPYRSHLVEQLEDAELRGAWEEFDQMKDGEKRTITEPIRTRMSPFYSNPDLTPIMCHPDTLDFRKMMQEKKVILISLKMDEERVPQTERDLIGALLISRLQMSGMYHQGQTPYFVYIDEVQRFVTSSLDNMFAEARKFGLSLTVAHQYLEQLPDTTQSAIMGNAGASVIFGCSPKDAQIFHPFTRPAFDVDDIVNLDQFTAVVKMQCDGVSQPAFTLLTPLPQVYSKDDLEQIPVFQRRAELAPDLISGQTLTARRFREAYAKLARERSQENYTPKKREEVNTWLRERYGKTVKLDDQTQFYDTGTP